MQRANTSPRPAPAHSLTRALPQLSQLPPRILIADDQPDVLEALRLLLKGEGFVVETVSSPAAMLRALDAAEYDCTLIDLNYTRDTTSGREGLTLLAKLQAFDPTLPVIVMTAWSSVESAVEAMQLGARDYVEKPWDNARLLATLRTQVELARALRATRRLAADNQRLRGTETRPAIVAESRAMQTVLGQLERIAPSDVNVLITGEHGTGKDVVARWIHAASLRADRPLITVNAGGIADTLFESELFGHVKGAFTDAKTDRVGSFELADGGTLFLDEIANVSLKQQSKLLRVLESGDLQRVGSSRVRRVDVRVLAATNADLAREVKEGRFREDLLYRLNTVEIHLPPLRERRDDVPELAALFLREQAKRYKKPAAELTPGTMRALLEHPWPGNVRELRHAVERAVLMARGPAVTEDDLGLQAHRMPSSASAPDELTDDLTLEGAERLLIQRALARYGGNVSRAADALGVSRSALYRRLQYYGL
jgi:DNA-binding NtrC family response regulator